MIVDDIPADYAGSDPLEGPRLGRFASGLQARLAERYGDDGSEAGHRLVQAAFQLRSARIGVRVYELASLLSPVLDDHDQHVTLSGNQLTVVSSASAIDLCAAAVVILAHGVRREPNLRQVADDKMVLETLPRSHREWLEVSAADQGVNKVIDVRNALVYRHVPLNVRVVLGAAATYEAKVDSQLVPVDPAEFYVTSVDRFVTLGLNLHADLDSDNG